MNDTKDRLDGEIEAVYDFEGCQRVGIMSFMKTKDHEPSVEATVRSVLAHGERATPILGKKTWDGRTARTERRRLGPPIHMVKDESV